MSKSSQRSFKSCIVSLVILTTACSIGLSDDSPAPPSYSTVVPIGFHLGAHATWNWPVGTPTVTSVVTMQNRPWAQTNVSLAAPPSDQHSYRGAFTAYQFDQRFFASCGYKVTHHAKATFARPATVTKVISGEPKMAFVRVGGDRGAADAAFPSGGGGEVTTGSIETSGDISLVSGYSGATTVTAVGLACPTGTCSTFGMTPPSLPVELQCGQELRVPMTCDRDHTPVATATVTFTTSRGILKARLECVPPLVG